MNELYQSLNLVTALLYLCILGVSDLEERSLELIDCKLLTPAETKVSIDELYLLLTQVHSLLFQENIDVLQEDPT